MAYTVTEQTMLMTRLAQKHRIEMAQLQQYTTVQLRELWRILEASESAEQWARAARNGFAAVLGAQQANTTVIAGALLYGAGEIYRGSGKARKGFKPSTGDTKGFLNEVAPVVREAAAREVGYHLSRAVRGEIPREKAVQRMAGVAQLAQLDTSREFINREALNSRDVPVSEEPVPVQERFALSKGSRSAAEHPRIDDSPQAIEQAVSRTADGAVDWLEDDEFIPDDHDHSGTWLDEFDSEEEMEEEFIGWEEDPRDAIDEDLIAEWKKEQKKPAAVHTDVRSGGCDYCKIVGIGKGPNKWHKGCSCINLPAWDSFEYGAPPWEDEMLDKYYTARAVAETYTDTSKGYVTMDDVMREIRIMDAMSKNKDRVAAGLKPRKIHDRRPPKPFKEKMKIRARNAAALQAEKDAGRW